MVERYQTDSQSDRHRDVHPSGADKTVTFDFCRVRRTEQIVCSAHSVSVRDQNRLAMDVVCVEWCDVI